jgi:hypothetical protein
VGDEKGKEKTLLKKDEKEKKSKLLHPNSTLSRQLPELTSNSIYTLQLFKLVQSTR